MATYRYARDSRTSAQTEARNWQVKVDMANQVIATYTHIATWRELTNVDKANLKRVEARLAKLMAENPNEAA
jgi:hypothetical protein